MSEFKIGQSKDTAGYTPKTYFELEDGDNVFRILPACGDDADSGVWASFYSVHFGYRNSANKMIAFVSPKVEDRKTKMVLVRDAAEDRLNAIRAKMEEAKAAGDEDTYQKLMPLVTKQYFQKNQWHLNAVDLSGRIGLLKVPHTVKKDMDVEIARLKSEGCDPRSVENGRFFVINRSGKGFQTKYSVRIYQESETMNGKVYKTDKVHVLTPDLIARLKNETSTLSKLYHRPTAEQVARIVAEGPTALDELFPQNSGGGSGGGQSPSTTTASAPTPAVATTAPASQATIKIAPAQVSAAPAQSAVSLENQSQADFMKQMGIG